MQKKRNRSSRMVVARELLRNAKQVVAGSDEWIVTYEGKDGDCYQIWVIADSEREAIREAERSYWDIVEIIDVERE